MLFRSTVDNDELAEEMAHELCTNATPSDFASGDEERDYALCDSGGTLIKDWD